MTEETAASILMRERDEQYMSDFRRRSADALASALFEEIEGLLPDDVSTEVWRRLRDSIVRNGVLLVRDQDRATLGLEPTDHLGWTPSERVKFKVEMMDVLMKTAQITVTPQKSK